VPTESSTATTPGNASRRPFSPAAEWSNPNTSRSCAVTAWRMAGQPSVTGRSVDWHPSEASGTSEGRQLRRWLTQLIVTERVVAAEVAARGLTARGAPAEAEVLPDLTARLEIGSVAAAALAADGQRVLVVDWDVHHGNGTQDAFWDDPRVLYGSVHQWPLYPGTGRAVETGGPSAPGGTVNVPVPGGATGDVARAAFDEVLVPAAERFRPDWVLVSAGFDAHRRDPLADLEWSAGDFADLAARVGEMAPAPGRTVFVLEGGYDLEALRLSVGAVLAQAAGVPFRPEPATSGGPGSDAVAAAQRVYEQVGVVPGA